MFDADSVVGPGGVDVPFEAVLFGVVLGQEVGVVVGLEGGDELDVVLSLAGRDELPEGVYSWGVLVGLEQDRPVVVEPEHAIASCGILVFGWTEGLQEDAVVGLDD